MFFRRKLDYDPKEYPRYRELFPEDRSFFAKLMDYKPAVVGFIVASWNILVITWSIIMQFFNMIDYNLFNVPSAVKWLHNEFMTADGCNMCHGMLLIFWLYRTGYSLSFVLCDMLKCIHRNWTPFYAEVWLDRLRFVGSALLFIGSILLYIFLYIWFSIPFVLDTIGSIIICGTIGILFFQIALYLHSISPPRPDWVRCPDWLRRPEPEPRSPWDVGTNKHVPFSVRFSNPPSPKTPKKAPPSPPSPPRAWSFCIPDEEGSTPASRALYFPTPRRNPFSSIKPPGAAYVKPKPAPPVKPAPPIKPKPVSSIKPPGASYQKVSPKAKHYLRSNGINPKNLTPKRSTNFQRLSSANQQNRPVNTELNSQWFGGILSSAERELAQMNSDVQNLKTLISVFHKQSCTSTQMTDLSPTTALLPRPEIAAIKGDNAREKLRFRALLAEYPPEIKKIVTYVQQSHPKVREALTNLQARIDPQDQSSISRAMRADYADCQEKLTRIVRITERAEMSAERTKERCLRRIEELSDEIARLDSIDLSHKKLKMRAYP
ncbi:hypothetical protein CEP52_013756 [Fusarium oligoseptatum]|uniref:Uncharacterized protein n=1 Tax=Fusarium oligoseptatum TaxID=2604345 RepID=A0A428SSA4_9HYPO|nr:hypothetical protein CEP52_013756 [Fusarium oligoseptatum]